MLTKMLLHYVANNADNTVDIWRGVAAEREMS